MTVFLRRVYEVCAVPARGCFFRAAVENVRRGHDAQDGKPPDVAREPAVTADRTGPHDTTLLLLLPPNWERRKEDAPKLGVPSWWSR